MKARISPAKSPNLLSHGLGISILNPINIYDFGIEDIRHFHFKKSSVKYISAKIDDEIVERNFRISAKRSFNPEIILDNDIMKLYHI